MTWREAWSLTTELLRDPSSHLSAAIAGWDYPLTREAIVAMDNYDLAHAIAAGKKRPKPYPRPWRDDSKTRIGGSDLPQDVIRAALKARGPQHVDTRHVAYIRADGTATRVTPAQAAYYARGRT